MIPPYEPTSEKALKAYILAVMDYYNVARNAITAPSVEDVRQTGPRRYKILDANALNGGKRSSKELAVCTYDKYEWYWLVDFIEPSYIYKVHRFTIERSPVEIE